jgi:radical SAM protein with 4Fe4S-binding SPASM domain
MLVVDEIDLSKFLYRASGTMMKEFRLLKKDCYQPNERIIVYIHGEIPWNLLAHLQRVVATLDITNCFIRLVNDCNETGEKIKKVRDQYASHDLTTFELDTDLSQYPVNHYEVVEPPPLLNPGNSMCMLPWKQLEIKPNGKVRTCCIIKQPIGDQDKIYNINDSKKFSWEDLYFSNSMTSLRQQFRNNQRPDDCSKCWQLESIGIQSHRQESPVEYLETNWEQEHLSNLTKLDIKPGNLCNLACRICNSNLSSTWVAEDLQQVPKNEIKIHPSYQNNILSRWPLERMDFWESTLDLEKQLDSIWLSGGETFMIPYLSRIFSIGSEDNRITLSINTNGTILPTEYFKSWKKYKLVRLFISVDDINDRFDYQRYGDHWNNVQHVISESFKQQEENIKITCICTVNIQNIFYLPEFYNWYKTQKFNDLFFNPLISPTWARLDQMTQQAQQITIEKLQNHDFESVQGQVDLLLKQLLTNPANSGIEFCKRTNELDRIRNQDFGHAHPEMAKAMGYVKK